MEPRGLDDKADETIRRAHAESERLGVEYGTGLALVQAQYPAPSGDTEILPLGTLWIE
jgi:hypothetical protein